MRTASRLLAALTALLLLPAASAAAKPGKLARPSNLAVSSVTASTLSVRWRDRAHNETRYRLRYRPTAAAGWRKLKLKRNSSGYTLPKLGEGTAYVIEVRACRGRACSRWSRPVVGSTLATNLGLCGVFPRPTGSTATSLPGEDAWNQDISGSPVDPGSPAIIASFASSPLHPDFGENPTYGIPYVIVSGSQPKLPINFRANGYDANYGDQSDPGPYPIPPNAPIEGGGGGDSHVIAVDRDNCVLYELYNADFDAAHNRWDASSGAVWNLRSIALRPDGWTSADAGGLPIFPGLVRYDEVASGVINHAIRVTFSTTRNSYIHPASHCAGSTTSTAFPPEGMRFRLKASYSTTAFTGQAAVVATALKTYGMLVADNGGNWFITGAANPASGPGWDDNDLNQLKTIPGSAFEVVQSAAAGSNAGC